MAFRIFIFVLGLLGLMQEAVAEQAVRRQDLEALLGAAAEVRLADQEAELALTRWRLAESDRGLKLFGSAGVTDAREPLTDTTSRSYQRLSAVAGLRLPLFGSRAVEGEAVHAAEASIRQRELARSVARREARKALHYAYSEAIRFREMADLANAFLAVEAQAERVLQARRGGGLLLEADRLEFSTMFLAARRNQKSYDARALTARRRLEMLSGRSLEAGRVLAPPAFHTDCLGAAQLAARASLHPELAMAAAALDEARRRRAVGSSLAEGGVVLSQTVTRDLGGVSGSATYLGVDFRVPLGWRGASDARQAQARLEVERAEIELSQRQAAFAAAVDEMQSAGDQRQAALLMARQRETAAGESLRVAELRALRLEGDALEKLLQGKYALYLAATDHREAVLAAEKAQADLLGLGDECPVSEPEAASGHTEAPLVAARLAAPLPVNEAAGDTAAGPAAMSGRPAPVGWYVWDSERLLARATSEEVWRDLAADARVLRLSFTAPQIAELAAGNTAPRLRAFLARARAEGIRVELLLGEPTWVMPEARNRLLSILQDLRSFAFDGVHLDLERSQLPAAQQAAWDAWVVDTVRAAADVSTWPVGLSGHVRDFSRRGLVERLRQAGLHELTLMAYQTDWPRVAARAEAVLKAHPGLQVSVAQSIEPQLTSSESFAGQGRGAARRAWSSLEGRLARQANFAGVVVQSLESFHEVKE